MTHNDLRAARALLLGLHAQADRNPRHKFRLPAIRAALACVELVQQETEPPPPVRVARLRPDALAYARTEWAQTQVADAA